MRVQWVWWADHSQNRATDQSLTDAMNGVATIRFVPWNIDWEIEGIICAWGAWIWGCDQTGVRFGVASPLALKRFALFWEPIASNKERYTMSPASRRVKGQDVWHRYQFVWYLRPRSRPLHCQSVLRAWNFELWENENVNKNIASASTTWFIWKPAFPMLPQREFLKRDGNA